MTTTTITLTAGFVKSDGSLFVRRDGARSPDIRFSSESFSGMTTKEFDLIIDDLASDGKIVLVANDK